MAYFITASASASVVQTTFDTTGSIVTSSLYTPNDPLNVDNITTIKKSRSQYPNLNRPIYKESVSFTNNNGTAVNWLYDNTASRDTDFNIIKILNTNYEKSGGGGSIDTGSFATTGSNNFIGNQVITGSLTVSGSSTFTNIGPAIFSGTSTFTNITASGNISASTFSGDGSGLTNVPESTDIDVYLNFEEATSFAYIVPYNLQFAGFTTSSAMTVQISSSGAPYVFTSSLSQFSTLSVTSSAAGLVTLSGSKL